MSSHELLAEVVKALDEFTKKANLPTDLIQISLEPQNYNPLNLSSDFPRTVQCLIKALQDSIEADKIQRKKILDPEMVQITASKLQLDKRIAAFISHAQSAVDEQNIQEFFPENISTVSQDGCARTHAVYRRRRANQTHMQVNRVKNDDGPQTQINSQGRWCSPSSRAKTTKNLADNCPEGVQERLYNLEQHIGINKNTAPKDVYVRIKQLEDRMLELESSSPEYLHGNQENADARSRRLSAGDKTSLVDIDDRIQYLKQKLMNKKFKSG